MRTILPLFLATLLGVAMPPAPAAEIQEVMISESPNIIFLPLTIMRHQRLMEKHAKAAGLGDIKVNWHATTGAGMTNDAVFAGQLHFGANGTSAFLQVWARTQGTPLAAYGIAAVSSIPQFLNTRNPNVRTVRDFTEKDRIALPTVKISVQANFLQMAAAQAFGPENFARLDPLTVTLNHSDATAAMLNPVSEINSHFTSPPFQYRQLKQPGIRKVLSSYDVIGGAATTIVMFTTRKFRDENPRTYRAFVAALGEAMEILNRDKRATARFYVEATKAKDTAEEILEIIADPQAEFTTTPRLVMRYAEFLHRTGQLKRMPGSWRELFFSEAHALEGS